MKFLRRAFAVFAVLVLVAGLAACGQGDTPGPVPSGDASPATAPASRSTPTASRTHSRPARLSPQERRQARRALRRLRKAASKPPRNVVTDSGLIP